MKHETLEALANFTQVTLDSIVAIKYEGTEIDLKPLKEANRRLQYAIVEEQGETTKTTSKGIQEA